jgi:hypothetical protein
MLVIEAGPDLRGAHGVRVPGLPPEGGLPPDQKGSEARRAKETKEKIMEIWR